MKKIAIIICMVFAVSMFCAACSGAGGETALEYKGSKLSEAMYGYWVARFKRNIIYSYSNNKDTLEFWNTEVTDGVTAEEYFSEIIDNQIYKYCIAQKLFGEYGLKLEDDIKQAIDNDIKEKIEYYGSRAELNGKLAEFNLNIDLLREIYMCEEKLNAVYSHLYGTGGAEALTDEDYTSFYNDNYWHIKYIVIYTVKLVTDSEGNVKFDSGGSIMTEPMPAEELQAQQAKAAEALEKARAGENFDGLIEIYSEYDTSANPSGFYLSVNDLMTYGSKIVSLLPGMQAGEVALAEEEGAVYIIKKLELPSWGALKSDELAQLSGLASYAETEAFENKMSSMFSEVKANKDVLDKYKLSEIIMLTDSNI